MTKEQALQEISALVKRFEEQFPSYKSSNYNETATRRDFIDPFFKALGWDMDNTQGAAEAYREVIHEDRVTVEEKKKAPDYSFRLPGGKRLFFVEAKKPSVYVKEEIPPAYQIKRYAWSAKLSVSILTDFEEFAVYDCTIKPKLTDKASLSRIKYLTFREYLAEFDFLWDTFAKENVIRGSFDKFVLSDKNKKGTATVDKEFLASLDEWRKLLAVDISKNNKKLDEHSINYAVQQTIDRIIFLRICEDRGIEPSERLKSYIADKHCYQNLFEYFKEADKKYNSGLFDFKKDLLSKDLTIDDKVLKEIIRGLYYPECPFEFSVLPVEILGSAYEQFLGKVIRLTAGHNAKVEEKPEVRKAGGVYYTPQYIVEYIVKNTVGKLVEGKTPEEVEKIKIVDPACGSGSFLIGAYQFLLDWHILYYSGASKKNRTGFLTPDGGLTTALKKKILLNNIFGVDLDDQAVEVTKLSLLLKCMEGETEASIQQQLSIFHERVLPSLETNIKCGNSLIGTDYYNSREPSLFTDETESKKINAFDWDGKDGFQEIMKSGGFNAVIGNPPYGADIVKEKNHFISTYEICEGNHDTFFYFIEKGINLLNKKGSLGFIIPDTWFLLKSAIKLRNFVLMHTSIREIQVLNQNVFADAKVDVCTIILDKSRGKDDISIKIFDKKATSDDIMKDLYLKEKRIKQDEWLKNPEHSFNFKIDAKSNSVLTKLSKAHITIDDYCLVGAGCKPYEVGKGVPPQTKAMLQDKIYTAKSKKNKTYRIMYRGADIARYGLPNKTDEWLSYGEWLAAPRNSDLFNNPRLLFQSIRNPMLKRRLVGTYLDDESVNNNSITNIIQKNDQISIKYCLGLLNSNLMNWYFSISYNIVNIDPRYIKMAPMPLFNKINHDLVANLVSKMLDLNNKILAAKTDHDKTVIQRQIDATDKEIDKLVYELYGLTEDEIKIVEGQ